MGDSDVCQSPANLTVLTKWSLSIVLHSSFDKFHQISILSVVIASNRTLIQSDLCEKVKLSQNDEFKYGGITSSGCMGHQINFAHVMHEASRPVYN